uniref:Uncharacterized protein n=1 Tax=uncultured marine thaumarchaeote AD1000_33_G09 TaxID=1455909 RepID=A0A075FNX0_9ARCH|nr:hypothetical protein [uncultured marine thaumarchaeote AD1000_33_G09]
MKTDTVEDISFLLYFMPVVMYIISTILHVTVSGLTFQESFLSVTRNPVWLVLSLLAISASLIFHIRSSNEGERTGLISIHAKRMRIIGIIIILLSLGEAIAVSDAQTNPIGLFITARLPILFTAIMFLQSAFIQIPFTVKTENNKFIISVFASVLILASPIVYYLTSMIGLPFVVNLGTSLALIIFGSLLFTRD